jgi:acetylornithine deacetylase/succinyl-diaminopimelate desuccinylase-like protein
VRTPDDAALRREAVGLLRDLLRADTSNPPGNETRAALVLRDYLEAAGVACELVARWPERANLVARLPGVGEGPSLALLGHTDVVPAEDAADWRHPPFAAHLDQAGFVWGRGAVDNKSMAATQAVAVAWLARAGFRPRGDLVLVAQADEEDGSRRAGLAWLRAQRPDLRCDYSLDEGGGRRLELADGRVVVTLNVGEKATLPVLVTARGEAGHASVPGPANAVLRLATLLERLGRHRPERRLLPETRRQLELLVGPLDGDLDGALERAGRLHPMLGDNLAARYASTIAPTRLRGSSARNVIPARASVECDCRVLPGTTPAALEAELRRALGDGVPYELEVLEPPTGGSSSPVDTPLYRACEEFLERHDPGAVLLPTISTGFTDSHFMREAFGTVAYGFFPVRHTPVEVYQNGFHSRDERIHADDLVYATRFYLHAVERLEG